MDALADSRTLTTTDGRRAVRTDLTDRAALALLADLAPRHGFARSLLRQAADGRPLSRNQWVWAHTLALEERAGRDDRREREARLAERPAPVPPAPRPGEGLDLAGLAALFGRDAVRALKEPSILLAHPDGGEVHVERGYHARYAGKLIVRGKVTDGAWTRRCVFGHLEADGRFVPTEHCTAALAELLARLAADPAGTAAEQGKLMGRCCFCRQALTDPRSLAVGYGPHCARTWRLPWGETVMTGDGTTAPRARRKRAAAAV